MTVLKMSKRRLKELKEIAIENARRDLAATKIQSRFRGGRGRNRARNFREIFIEEMGMAIRIQGLARCWLARRRLYERRYSYPPRELYNPNPNPNPNPILLESSIITPNCP